MQSGIQAGDPPPHGQRAAGGWLYPDRDPDRGHADVGRGRCDDARVRCRGAHNGAGAAAGGCRAPGPGRGRPPRRSPVRGAGHDLRAAVLERSAGPRLQGVGKQLCGALGPERAAGARPGPGATAKVEPGPEDFAVGTGGGTIAGSPSPLRHVARRELPTAALRGRAEHQARDRRGDTHPAARNRRPGAHMGLDHRGGPRHRAARVAGAAGWRPGGRRPGDRRLVLPLRHSLRAGHAAAPERQPLHA